jgi:hypothetical protein
VYCIPLQFKKHIFESVLLPACRTDIGSPDLKGIRKSCRMCAKNFNSNQLNGLLNIIDRCIWSSLGHHMWSGKGGQLGARVLYGVDWFFRCTLCNETNRFWLEFANSNVGVSQYGAYSARGPTGAVGRVRVYDRPVIQQSETLQVLTSKEAFLEQ